MAESNIDTPLKRLRNRYRLVVMNDDSYEEVVTFKLSRLSVYIGLSTLFVVLTGLTVALIVFTPLKLYIPGYGSASATRELRQLKMRTDSLEQEMEYRDKYLNDVKKVLQGDASVKLDTTSL
ncbi:MAG TPA: hypothetical protein PLQ32_08885, partial [Flavihumibacter sp.]|nr:hypothetical protein [Flavihumibacter sp.]